jgi:peptide/nickel transport system permease protein
VVRFIIRRLVLAVFLLIIISIVTFGIFMLMPKLTGTDIARMYAGKVTSPEAVEGIRVKMGFDKPVWEQYFLFMKGIVAGRDFANGPDIDHCAAPCFGYSFRTNQAVWPLLLDRLPVTLSLALGAAVLWLVGGVASGVISALRRGTVVDRAAMVVALAGVSLPVYFTGLVVQLIFVHQLHWFPNTPYVNFFDNPGGWAMKLLPAWFTLALLYAATYTRLTRASMLETMTEDYVRTARAKGLRERTVIARHAMRSVLTPIVTIFGLDLGGLLGGAILTERVFSLTGLGLLTIQAIPLLDLPTIMGVTLFAAAFIVLANLIVDVLYAVIDPRVRLS